MSIWMRDSEKGRKEQERIEVRDQFVREQDGPKSDGLMEVVVTKYGAVDVLYLEVKKAFVEFEDV